MNPNMTTANSTPAVLPKKKGILSRVAGAVKRQYDKNNNTPKAKEYRKQRALNEIKNIERGFNTLDDYRKFAPEQGAAVDKLIEEAGYATSSRPRRFFDR